MSTQPDGASPPAPSAEQPGTPEEARTEMIEHPAKILRIGGMIRELLEEVRRGDLEDEGRMRAKEICERAIAELKSALSPDLKAELDHLVVPFPAGVPTQSELRVSQAQLVGWFEGLFHGMQAILFGPQRPQLAMPPMGPPGPFGPMGTPPSGPESRAPGQYL